MRTAIKRAAALVKNIDFIIPFKRPSISKIIFGCLRKIRRYTDKDADFFILNNSISCTIILKFPRKFH